MEVTEKEQWVTYVMASYSVGVASDCADDLALVGPIMHELGIFLNAISHGALYKMHKLVYECDLMFQDGHGERLDKATHYLSELMEVTLEAAEEFSACMPNSPVEGNRIVREWLGKLIAVETTIEQRLKESLH